MSAQFNNLVNYTEIPTTGKQRTISFNEESLYENDLDTKKTIDELGESDDLIEPIDELGVIAKTNEIRAKHKNRRHTKSEDYPEENPNKFSKALSASLPNHFSFNTSSAVKNWSKKFSKNSRRSRRERSRGMAKKGGQGGKFTWTGDNNLVDVDENGVEDPSDINYDSDKDNCEFVVITPPLSDEEIERHVTASVSEYYEHCDSNEVAYQLEEFNFNGKEYQIVVIAVTIAMEHKSSHRELTSVLISDLYDRILKMPDYEQAFKILIKNLPDLILDTPDAAIVLGNFIARAIADDCLPPCFVTKLKQTLVDPLQLQSIEHASSLLDSRFSMMKLDTIWGISGGMRPVFCLVDRLQLLLDEYISSGDIDEATRCLKELETPHLHHHLIYEGILKALEDMRERTLVLISELFQYLYKTVVVTVDQLTIGFNQVYEEMEDIVVDIPLAYPLLERLVEKCSNFLPRDLVKQCPLQQRGRKRCVSESDGKYKEDL